MAVGVLASSIFVLVGTSTSADAPPFFLEGEAGQRDHETMVVTGSRVEQLALDAAVDTEIILRRDIERSGARNVAEILESTPGMRVVPDVTGAVQIQLRGFDADQVLVLVDGQRITGRKNGAIDLSRLGVERIERIEIVKGPASAIYGADALAGVINIITRGPRGSVEGDLRLSYGAAPELGPDDPKVRTPTALAAETAEAAGRVGGLLGDLSWQASGGYRRRGPYDLDPSTPGLSGSAVEDGDIDLTGWYKTDGLRLRMRFEGSLRFLSGIDSGPQLPSGQRRVDDRRQRIQTLGAFSRAELDVLGGLLAVETSWSLYDDRVARIQRGDDDQSEDSILDQLGQAALQYDRLFFGEHRVLVGLDALYETLDSTRFPNFDERGRFGYVLQDEWTPIDELSVLAGIRVDVDTQFGTFPTPRVAVRYRPIDPITLRGSWGLGFKAPLPRDLGILFENPGAGYRVEGNPGLRPEETSTFSTGASFTPLRALVFEVDVFQADITNLIVALPQSASPGEVTVFRYENVASARIRGLELGARWMPNRYFRASLGYDGLETRDLEEDQPLPNRAPHRVTAGMGVNIPDAGLDLDVRGAWTDARFISRETSADPYVRLDARLEYEVSESFLVFSGADNLFDAGDPELLAIPPRTFYAGMQSHFR